MTVINLYSRQGHCSYREGGTVTGVDWPPRELVFCNNTSIISYVHNTVCFSDPVKILESEITRIGFLDTSYNGVPQRGRKQILHRLIECMDTGFRNPALISN